MKEVSIKFYKGESVSIRFYRGERGQHQVLNRRKRSASSSREVKEVSMGGGSVASGAPIVDTKSKEYRREAMFLVLNVLRDLIVFIYLPFISL